MNYLKKRGYLFLLLFVVISLPIAGTAWAADEATVSIIPEQVQTTPGQEFQVQVIVANAQDLTGVEVEIQFDSQYLEGVSLAPGALLVGKQITLAYNPLVDNENGKMDFAFITNQTVAGNGELLLLTFRCLREGSTNLTIERADLVDANSLDLVNTVTKDSLVQIGATGGTSGNNNTGGNSTDSNNTVSNNTDSNSNSNTGNNNTGSDNTVNNNADNNAGSNNTGSNNSGGNSTGVDLTGAGPSGGATTNQTAPGQNQGEAHKFKDLADNHWAGDAVTKLTAQGVISGYEDGTFRPENKVTREEFVVMVARALNLPVDTQEAGFKDDTNISSWARAMVTAAARTGLVTGSEGLFHPGDYITRAEIAAVLVRALEQRDVAVSQASISFTDAEAVPWARENLAEAYNADLITGYEDNTVRAGNTATRAETAVMISRLLAKIVK